MKLTIMNGTYGIQTRGDPPVRFGARGDPPVVNSLRDDSFERELIFNRITGLIDPNGRGMFNNEQLTVNSEQC